MKLLSPIPIGGYASKNRVMFGPHLTNLGQDRAPSEDWLAYFEARIVGGAGIVVTEEASVHQSDWPTERWLLAERCPWGWKRLADMAKTHGTLMIASIGHAGGEGSSAYSQRAMLAPSPVPEVDQREMPKELEEFEVELLLESFSKAAASAVDAGMNGVEINLSTRSLIRQFLSPLSNQRTDELGSDRSLFLRKIVAAVRSAIGSELFAVRLTLDEFAPWGGLEPEALCTIAKSIASSVDLFTVTSGSLYTKARQRPDFHTREAFNDHLATLLNSHLEGSTPVFLQGSVTSAAIAEVLLTDQICDGVEMTRAQIADPNMVNNLTTTRSTTPCVLCNHFCMVGDSRNLRVSCLVNPDAGYELSEPEKRRTSLPMRRVYAPVKVIGAGPAGMEFALKLAEAGRTVEIIDSSEAPGGLLTALAAHGVGGIMLRLRDFYLSNLASSKVRIELGYRLGITELEMMLEDSVVVEATGATGSMIPETLRNSEFVRQMSTQELVMQRKFAAERSVVIDDRIGNHEAAWAAELAVQFSESTHLVTPDPSPLSRLNTGDLMDAVSRLRNNGVITHTLSKVRSNRLPSAVTIESLFSDAKLELQDPLLITVGIRNSATISPDLVHPKLFRIGDCLAPRNMHYAILEARRLADRLLSTGAD